MAFNIIGQTTDHRTQAKVLYCKCSINDYLKIVGEDFENFSIQRKRETHKAYKRLKDDLKEGALLPSITLALKPHLVPKALELIDDNLALTEYINEKNIADILDGLQRTYLIKDLVNEDHEFPEDQEVLLEYWIEGEISRLIYRMIVLNAGQKAMSIRHQIELLFMSLKETISEEIQGIDIFVEKDGARRTLPNKYSLGVIASAYQAFLTRSTEIDKDDLVSNALIKETVMDASEDEHTAKFSEFIDYFKSVKQIDAIAWDYYEGLYDDGRFKELNDSKDNHTEDEQSEFRKLRVYKNAKNWLGSDNVMLSMYSSIAQFSNTGRKSRVAVALAKLKEDFEQGELDPLGLVSYERFRSEINPKKSNVGIATRKLLLNGFREYFRDEGETPFSNCWEQAQD